MVKTEFPAEKWNKKRVIFAILVILFLIIGGLELKAYVLDSDNSNSVSNPKADVRGTNVSPSPTIDLPSAESIGQGAIQNLNNIKQEINNINVQDLATSSPQIQKIVNDIKALPSVPGQQAKDICLKVCNGL